MTRGRTIAVIPARGGSKGLPGKNVLPIAGKPLIAYTIEAAVQEGGFDEIIVSTDDAQIAAVARQYPVEVVARPPETATDTAPIDLALRHAVRWSEAGKGPVDVVVWLQANVPHRKPGIIEQVIAKLVETGADCVETVVPYRVPPQWARRIEGDKLLPLEGCYKYATRRQDMIPAFHPDGAVIAIRRDVLMDTEGLPDPAYMGEDIRAVVQPEEYGLEIDEPLEAAACRGFLKECLS